MNISDRIKKILPDDQARMTCLNAFQDSIGLAKECCSKKWVVHCLSDDKLRLVIGDLRVFTIEKTPRKDKHKGASRIWLALFKDSLHKQPEFKSQLDNSSEWEWGPSGTLDGEYPNPPSRNGYYYVKNGANRTDLFSEVIWPLHNDYIPKVVDKNANLKKNNNCSELLEYLEARFTSPDTHTIFQLIDTEIETPVASDIDEPDPSVPDRILTKTYRILRDTKLATSIKQRHNYECQICGKTIELPNGKRYAEVHHIKPLGSPHDGPDVEENIICVCPNHHAALDYFAIKLERSQITAHENIGDEYINYHNQEYARQFHP